MKPSAALHFSRNYFGVLINRFDKFIQDFQNQLMTIRQLLGGN